MYRMYLDDLRESKNDYDVIVRSFDEATGYISEHGIPVFISFDHDLGLDDDGSVDKSGYDLAKWLVEQSLDGVLEFPKEFSFFVHSANPLGKINIESILNNYIKFRTISKYC
jgi:hypothetical protein